MPDELLTQQGIPALIGAVIATATAAGLRWRTKVRRDTITEWQELLDHAKTEAREQSDQNRAEIATLKGRVDDCQEKHEECERKHEECERKWKAAEARIDSLEDSIKRP